MWPGFADNLLCEISGLALLRRFGVEGPQLLGHLARLALRTLRALLIALLDVHSDGETLSAVVAAVLIPRHDFALPPGRHRSAVPASALDPTPLDAPWLSSSGKRSLGVAGGLARSGLCGIRCLPIWYVGPCLPKTLSHPKSLNFSRYSSIAEVGRNVAGRRSLVALGVP